MLKRIIEPEEKEQEQIACVHSDEIDEYGDEFAEFHRSLSYREPRMAVCECGETFPLVAQYLGACECPGCGTWYNVFGQELNPVETWADGDDW